MASAHSAALTGALETKVRQKVNQSLLLVYVYVPLLGVITHVFSPPIFPTSLSKLLRRMETMETKGGFMIKYVACVRKPH